MKVLVADREFIYRVVSAAFKATNTTPAIAELGVLDGKNAEIMFRTISPGKFYLIDSWSKDIFEEYQRNNAHRSWVSDVDSFSYYFGGPLTEQTTLDRLYDQTKKRFHGNESVHILRKSTKDAVPELKSLLGLRKLDLIYVDASHQYETVFDDLMEYRQFLDPHGFFQLNDCCHSPQGMKQNLGVLEAAVKFCKVADYVPVLLTNTDWTDVLMVSRSSSMIKLIDRIVSASDVNYVEIPPQLFGALSVKYGKRTNLSFC